MDFNLDIIQKNLQDMLNAFAAMIPNILVGLVIFVLFFYTAKLVQFVVAKIFKRKHNLSLVLSRLSRWAVMIVGVFITVIIIFPSVDFGDFLAALGIGSVAIGFAFKDIFQNFLSGILILLTEPFKVGDEIILEGTEIEGKVTDIQTRATFIRTYDGRRVVIPNSKLYTGSVTVITALPQRRSQYDVGVGVDEDLEKVQEIILTTLKTIDEVLEDPGPDTQIVNLGNYSNSIRMRWWTDSTRSRVTHVKSDVLTLVYDKLVAEGIDLPYPISITIQRDEKHT